MIATIQDVAKRAKVSASTVSKVLSRRSDVGDLAIKAVHAAVADLQYVKRPRGRRAGLRGGMTRRTNRIALVVPGLPRAAMNAPVYLDVLHGVEAAVRERGKTFMLLHLPPDEVCPAELFSQKVDGVVMFGGAHDARLSRRLRTSVCVQVMGTIEPDGLWDHISYDNAKLGRIAAEYLLSRGHRYAAFVSSGRRQFFAERGEVFRRIMAAAGGVSQAFVDETLVDMTGNIQQVLPGRMKALVDGLLGADPRPTAVFLVADNLTQGFYGELYRRGMTPVEDIDVISCNNEQLLLGNLHPRPATIDIHAERVGYKAVEQLLWRLEHPRDPRVTIALEPTLVEGDVSEGGGQLVAGGWSMAMGERVSTAEGAVS